VVVLPLLLSFLVWTVLRWRRQRRRGFPGSTPDGA
jgi:hypothetical protein